MNKKQKASFVLNCLIFVFTVFATVSMLIGFNFMNGTKVLSSTSYKAFKFFNMVLCHRSPVFISGFAVFLQMAEQRVL